MKYDIEKKVYWSLQSIDYLHQETPYKTILPNTPIDGCISISKKNENENFKIKFLIDKPYGEPFLKNLDDYGINENILFENDGKRYCINKDSVSRISRSLSNPSMVTIEVNNFQKGENIEFNNTFIRLIIPCEKEPSFDVFNCKVLHISGTTTFQGLLEVFVKGKKYHVFKYKNEDASKKYLIIDSLEENEFNEFKENTSAIVLAYGYITGNLLQNEYYYHSDYRNNGTQRDSLSYYKKEQSVITGASLFDTFQFQEYLKYLKKEDVLDRINLYLSSESFSKIAEKIVQNDTFSRCITLILHANNANSLLLRAGIYSIALETLTNIIYEENKEKINPISDKKLALKIQEKFKKVIEEYDVFISDYGKQVIEAKINDMNKPTNSKKLTKPFELYGIALSKADIEILNHRNKFLHGSSPFDESQLKEKEKELKYISSKLFSLLNTLILKYCGYSGHIVDYGSWHQLKWEEKVTEHLFKII